MISRMSPSWSEVKAEFINQVVDKIFESDGGPNFNNLYSRCVYPMSSIYVIQLIELKTLHDKIKKCLPLEQFLAEQLAASDVEVVIEGLYLPTNK